MRKPDDRMLAMSPHGGNIETDTSDQVALFATTLEGSNGTPVNTWNLEGSWGDGQTFPRWHITSTMIEIASYPGLTKLLPFAGGFDRAVVVPRLQRRDREAGLRYRPGSLPPSDRPRRLRPAQAEMCDRPVDSRSRGQDRDPDLGCRRQRQHSGQLRV